MKELLAIQKELKAPKNQYNSFGKYSYRCAEDILEAVKPLLVKYEAVQTITDDVIQIGERYYVKATVRVTNKDGVSIETCGWAREEDTKKGMDASQITGAASSYARKYALNGMYCIDDNKDSDYTNTKSIEEAKADVQKAKSKSELTELWNTYKAYHNDAGFKKLVADRGKELK